MTTLEVLLGPEEVFTTLFTETAETTARTASTHKGNLRLGGGAILLCEIRALKFRVGGNSRKLLEFQSVKSIGRDKGQEAQNQGSERSEDHGWRQNRGTRRSCEVTSSGVGRDQQHVVPTHVMLEIRSRLRLVVLLTTPAMSALMSTRSTRRSTANTAEPDMSVLKNIDCLILAQAVWEIGSNSWPAVAKILSKHPLLFRPKSFFTAQVSPGYSHDC